MVKSFAPSLQLVLAGGEATDDPEGAAVLAEVRNEAGADLVVQKSLKEGFGLTVTEALWKGKPVIGGDAGGILLQVVNHHTGFLVKTPEGAALRARYLLRHPDKALEMGRIAKELVRQNFLLTRNLQEYLSILVVLIYGDQERIELQLKSAP